jgi:5,6,7,8-tetrahydromethanopterin hydro-lyase
VSAGLDGRIGEGWGGVKPNGSHVNVVLATRGSATFAAAISMLAQPSPGHTPVLVCVGPEEKQYEPIWPPTLMMNKATARDENHETMTWGAATRDRAGCPRRRGGRAARGDG